MIYYSFMSRRGHRDKVSYLEAFLIDSILIGWNIHLSYIMMQHMIAYYQSNTWVFPYDHFLIRVFKDVNINLSKETDFEAPSAYDTYDD